MKNRERKRTEQTHPPIQSIHSTALQKRVGSTHSWVHSIRIIRKIRKVRAIHKNRSITPTHITFSIERGIGKRVLLGVIITSSYFTNYTNYMNYTNHTNHTNPSLTERERGKKENDYK